NSASTRRSRNRRPRRRNRSHVLVGWAESSRPTVTPMVGLEDSAHPTKRKSMRPVAIVALFLLAAPTRGQDVNDKAEAAIKAAVARVAPSVVRIETSGGAEVVGAEPGGGAMGGGVRKGRGPTTGLVVAPDGYVITSSFNFANKPATIFVSVPGRRERF